MATQTGEKLVLNVWDKALPDLASTQGTVVETYVYDLSSPDCQHFLCVVGQIYSGKPRKENALFLSRMVEGLKKEFTRNPEADPYTALTLSLSRANEIAKEAQRTLFSDSPLKINMVAMSIKGSHVLFSRTAQGIVLRKRDDTVELLTGKQIYSNDPFHHLTFHRINETTLNPNDVLYLGTPQIFKVGEEAFAPQEESFVLPSYVTTERPELRNIGIIAIRASDSLSISATPAPENEVFDIKSNEAKVEKNGSWRGWAKVIAISAAGVAILAALFWFALPHEKTNVHSDQEKSAMLISVQDMTQKTETLIELENYSEAAQMIEEINKKISILETMGAPPEVAELKEAVRYLSSLVPILGQ